jgi:calmodulin
MSITTQEVKDIVAELFTQLDKDASGFLEKAEVRQVAINIHAKFGEGNDFNEEKFSEGFTKLDKSGDGKISLEELTNMFLFGAAQKGILSDAPK